MAVTVTVSETVAGSEVSDALAGGSTGVSLGQVTNGSYAPVISQGSNSGAQPIYIRHDATIDPITSVTINLEQYSGTYGGANSAAADYATVLADGAADSGATAGNDGSSGGLHVDFGHDVTTSNQFYYNRFTTSPYQHRIFGKANNGLDGTSSLPYPVPAESMCYYNGSSTVAASGAASGIIGKSTDSVYGNRALFFLRYYLKTSATEGGVLQWDLKISFSYTA